VHRATGTANIGSIDSALAAKDGGSCTVGCMMSFGVGLGNGPVFSLPSWRPNERAQQMWQALAGAAREARGTKRARDGRGQRRTKRPSDARVTIDL